jgi:hypothetical protein
MDRPETFEEFVSPSKDQRPRSWRPFSVRRKPDDDGLARWADVPQLALDALDLAAYESVCTGEAVSCTRSEVYFMARIVRAAPVAPDERFLD